MVNRKQNPGIKARRKKLAKLAAKEATKGLAGHECAFFLLPKEHRERLIKIKALKVYVLRRALKELDQKAQSWTLPAWALAVYPPIKVHPFALYVFRHVDRKHCDKTNYEERSKECNKEFWDIMQQWVDDRSAADNIIGMLELEKESFAAITTIVFPTFPPHM